MKKVYLLLRNNQQTGPYSFEELLELHLKPFDLVWVEGKSCGWRYPNEIETLKTFFPAPETSDAPDAATKPAETSKPFEPAVSYTPPPTPKNIFVSMPLNAARQSLPKQPIEDPIEQKAEELRKRALSYTAPQEPVQTNYTRKLQEAEEEYTQWTYQKKTKKSLVNKKWLAISCTGVVLLFAAWWAGSNVFKTTAPATSTTLHQTEKQEQDPVAAEEINTPNKEPELAKKVPVSSPVHSTTTATANKEPAKKQTIKKQITLPEQTITTTAKPKDEAVEKIIDNASPVETQEEIVAETPAEKKKTLKERVSELFKKRNPDEAMENSQSKPAENKNGERTATRRNDNAEANVVVTDVSDQVEIKTNKIADSWMMGVKNLKLTLSNRSKLTINSAKVEVLYYSEQNNLLDKKILSFSNIPPGKSQTVPAPDQRLADHIEYKILSANGVDNAYAKQ
jgi:hypothetical protein